MICQECNEQVASLHFTKIVNGKKDEVHICTKCAREKSDLFLSIANDSFSFNDLLASFMNPKGILEKNINHTSNTCEIKCSNCGLTYDSFIEGGKLGCNKCYEVFDIQLNSILKRLHSGNIEHNGKIPKRTGGTIAIKSKVRALKTELQHAIAQQEFERAAIIRDEIHGLEEMLNIHGKGDS